MSNLCYFCQSPIILFDHDAENYDCLECMKKYDLHRVVMTMSRGKLWYVHIYVDLGNKNSRRYHVRLHLQENLTQVFSIYRMTLQGFPVDSVDSYDINMIIPGFPLTSSNIKNRLLTFLVFS